MEAESNGSERKTLDQRAQMTELERLRHSCAHVMATAILRLWPDAQFAYGPPVENGFYYDVELEHRISPEDFPAIEAEMKKEIKGEPRFRTDRGGAGAGAGRRPERRLGGWGSARPCRASSSWIC
jgi:threonyl-tRNA synthetase